MNRLEALYDRIAFLSALNLILFVALLFCLLLVIVLLLQDREE